jgi:hypothetical protein
LVVQGAHQCDGFFEDRGTAALGQGGDDTPIVHPSGRDLDDPGGGFGSADIEADGANGRDR